MKGKTKITASSYSRGKQLGELTIGKFLTGGVLLLQMTRSRKVNWETSALKRGVISKTRKGVLMTRTEVGGRGYGGDKGEGNLGGKLRALDQRPLEWVQSITKSKRDRKTLGKGSAGMRSLGSAL